MTRWALGCGAGCLVLVVLVVALVAGGVSQVKRLVGRFEEAEAVKTAVAQRYGDIDDFVPDAEGSIRPERVEAFLRVRDLSASTRAETESALEVLARAERGEGNWSLRRVLTTFRAGAGAPTRVADFYTGRSEAMLEGGMGLGEYYYIYVLAYFSLLEKSPDDGPPFRLVGGSEHDDGWDESDVREQRAEQVRQRVRQQMLPMLRRQLEAFGDTRTDARWREVLATEITAMEADPRRLPWADGLPGVIEMSLLPFRERLESSYSELCNPLEIHQH